MGRAATRWLEQLDDAMDWDDRYNKTKNGEDGKIETFDWHQSFEKLNPLFQQYGITVAKRCLIIGCGNSQLSEDMVDGGFSSIVGVDWSQVVMDKMRERCKEKTGITFEKMDFRDMCDIEDASMDCVIDKGLMDCMMAFEKSTDQITEMLLEVQKKLPPPPPFLRDPWH